MCGHGHSCRLKNGHQETVTNFQRWTATGPITADHLVCFRLEIWDTHCFPYWAFQWPTRLPLTEANACLV